MATTEADLTEWVDLAAQLLLGPATAPSVADVLDLAHRVFECTVSWHWFQDDGMMGWHTVAPGSWPTPELVERWLRDQERHALLRWFTVTQTVQAMTLERVPWQIADERQVRWTQELLGSTEMTQELSMPVEVGASHQGLLLSRGGRDFPDEVLGLARQVQPLLMLVERHGRSLDRLGRSGFDPATFDLTGREAAVLGLLTEGLTAAAIARRLGCAERTVNKHLEHLYRKLDVHDRLGAVCLVHAHEREGGGLVANRLSASRADGGGRQGHATFEVMMWPPRAGQASDELP